ncbi:MAG: hypothetical protein QNK29_07945 [Desulfobacterales bacterium]|jgi:hypothetical protein|nr:hypothetical protein [Desulfobacterales bacterium]MDX2511875.1 hypothetical protein [Desulfobacterales bacterium]
MLLLCVSILAGCQSIGNVLGSKKILTKHLLFIPRQGSLHVTWEARHLTIAFKGRVSQNILTMNGRIDINSGGNQQFTLLDRLIVDIYLTDSAGNVLGKHTFYSTEKLPVHATTPRTFRHRFDLPKGTSHIAFGYDGTAREGGSKALLKKRNAIEHRFQHSPFR